jgi:predicted ATPase/DNA-binding SARP family transcriptional activator
MTTSAPPSPSTSSSYTHVADLPVHLTRFIGRDHELTELSRLIGATRLLTLTGAGGSGKTRLAREVAAAHAGRYARIGWVDLAPITDPVSIAREVATALHIPDRGGRPAEALVETIADSAMLLVLDNCEHLVDAAAELAEQLLRACPRLNILATSREALGIPSETAWLVPPLGGAEAAQLFVERAQASLPAFELTETNSSAVRDICRRLDGIPLAIELAAARVRVLSPEQIAARLDDAFRLLTTGSRTALPRQRTLRGTMDWSYSLLDTREQALLRRLAVFAGSFSLEAAEAVCVGDPLEAEDILDGVAALVDKSLVVMEAGDGAARYRLLETVRQYGLELLNADGDVGTYRARHAHHYLEFAERFAPLLVGGEHEPGLLARIAVEHDNLRDASVWAANDPSRAEEALRFADALFWYWYGTGYWYGSGQFTQARDQIARALSNAPNADPLLRARALAADGLSALAQGDYEDSRRSFSESLELFRAHGDVGSIAFVLSKLGATYMMLGNTELAGRLLDESFEMAKPLPLSVLHSFIRFWRGWAAIVRGELPLARDMFEEGILFSRQINHRTSFAHACAMLGKVLCRMGEYDEAYSRLSDGLRVHLEIGDAWGLALDLEGLAGLVIARERYADGVRLIGAVDALRERVAIALPASDRSERERLVTIARDQLGGYYERMYDEGRKMPMEEVSHIANEAGGLQTAEYQIPVLGDIPSTVTPPVAPAATLMLRVLALGPLQVFVGDEAIDTTVWGSARPRELLVYLLMHPDGRTKEQVGLAFWPEASTAQLRNSFHVTLHRLRKALRNPDWITLTNDRYRVDPAVIAEFDVAEFEREVVVARRALKRREEGAAAALERTVARFRGDFLDGEPAGDWHLEHRDRQQRLFVDSLMELGERHAEEGRNAKAADAYRRVLARDDLNEDATRALMRCYAKAGERAQALRLYQRFAERLRKELDAEPEEETQELLEEIKAG